MRAAVLGHATNGQYAVCFVAGKAALSQVHAPCREQDCCKAEELGSLLLLVRQCVLAVYQEHTGLALHGFMLMRMLFC